MADLKMLTREQLQERCYKLYDMCRKTWRIRDAAIEAYKLNKTDSNYQQYKHAQCVCAATEGAYNRTFRKLMQDGGIFNVTQIL